MFEGISNDPSLQSACPSLARVSAAYREGLQNQTTERTALPLEKLKGALNVIAEQFASFVPGSSPPAELACQLAAARPAIVEAMHGIAGNPEAVASEYRLVDETFDRLWEKALKVTSTLETLLNQGEMNSASTIGELHARVLDAILELNRWSTRSESFARPKALDETETPVRVSLSDARIVAQELDERVDDTGWLARGL